MEKSSAKASSKSKFTEGEPGSKSGKEIKVSPKKDNEKGLAATSTTKAKMAPKE